MSLERIFCLCVCCFFLRGFGGNMTGSKVVKGANIANSVYVVGIEDIVNNGMQ